MNIYFVYAYFHPRTGLPFYIGYGKNNRHLSHLKDASKENIRDRNYHKINTIKKILQENTKPVIQKLAVNLTKEAASELEEFLISEVGRRDLDQGPLTNLTDGGDGHRGWSPEQRSNMSEKRKNLVQAKDSQTDRRVVVHKDDLRWVSGELVGQNLGISLDIGDKLKDYIQAKDPTTGVSYRVKKDDPRWVSGELVGINKGVPCHKNTVDAAKMKKGIPKPVGHGQKVAAAIKHLKWYCNFETNQVGRFRESEQPAGYIRVSGPHKKTPI